MLTALYAAFLGTFMVVLATRVIALRGNPIFAFFRFASDGDEALERAIRGHGNLTENAPIFLILLLVAEHAQSPTWLLHASAICFCLGRLMHGILFCFLKKSIPLRIGGMAFTFTGILVLCGVNAWAWAQNPA